MGGGVIYHLVSRLHLVHLRKYRQSLVKLGWLAEKNRTYRILVTTIRPPFPPPGSLCLSFPLSRYTTRLESPAARRTTQHTDSCDRLTTKGGKMEHRGADFNIMLATDSYKVPYRWWFQAVGDWAEGSGWWRKIDKVKVVSSSVPRPSYCLLWPVSVGSQQAERAGEGSYSRDGVPNSESQHPSLS